MRNFKSLCSTDAIGLYMDRRLYRLFLKDVELVTNRDGGNRRKFGQRMKSFMRRYLFL